MDIYAGRLGDAISSAAHWPRRPGGHRVARGLRHLGHGHQHPDELSPSRSGERHQPLRSAVGLDG